MKQIFKRTILLAICILTATVIFAQHTEWGVKTGVNLATQVRNITKISDNNMRTGIYAGLFAEYRVSNSLGIQGELLYSEMGGKFKYQGPLEEDRYNGYPSLINTNPVFNDTNKNDYIVLPIMAKLYVAKKLSIDLGPQFGYMISAKYKSNNELFNGSYYSSSNNNKIDASLGIGLSYKLGKLDISGRYNLGITDVSKYSSRQNYVIQFGLGYRIK